LIKKLKGATQEPPPPATAAPASPTPAASAPGQVGPPAQPTSSARKPEQAAKRSDSGGAPSVDLEIFLAYRSIEITPEAASALVPLGRALSDHRLAGNTFLIAGHSDGKGSADYNVDLSQKRAEAVRLYLIAKFGIGAERLVAKVGCQAPEERQRPAGCRKSPRANRQCFARRGEAGPQR